MPLTNLRKLLVAWVGLAGVGIGGMAAQESGLFFDTVDVNVINIEVVVTDREGNAVAGLQREDFALFEDGEQVELSNFFEVAGGKAAPASPNAGPATEPASPQTQRLQAVIYVDNNNLRPENRNLILDNLRTYIQELMTPEDRVMLVTAGDSVEVTLPFTNDPARLLVALDGLERKAGRQVQFDLEVRSLLRQIQNASLATPSAGGLAASSQSFDMAIVEAERLATDIQRLAERRYRRVQATARILAEFSDTLAGMTGRKAILYVSDGLPLRAAEGLVQAWLGKYESWMMQQGQTGLTRQLTALTSLEFDAGGDLRALAATANANRVAFYPISQASRRGSHISAENRGALTLDGAGSAARDVAQMENLNRESSLLRLAEDTGGLAFTRTANISALLKEIRRDFSSFYSLGYNRPPADERGKTRGSHRLELKVRGEGLKVRYLKSYEERTPLDLLEDRTLTALHYGIEENPLNARLEAGVPEPAADGKERYEVPFLVKIPFQNLLLLPQDAAHAAQVTLLVVARDERGGVSPVQRIELPVRIPNDKLVEALAGVGAYPMRLQMRRGRQRVAVGIRDHLARTDAILNLEVDVHQGEPADPRG